MRGGAAFGFWVGLAWGALTMVAPQPYGAIVYWLATVALLICGSTLCWRRMRLPYAAASMAIAAAGSVVLAAMEIAGYRFPFVPWQTWAALGLCIAASGVLFVIESRVHRDAWRRWKVHAENTTVWDALHMRHIPTMHQRKNGTGSRQGA
jgi:hypothetical protein